jgi:hypothetical protein
MKFYAGMRSLRQHTSIQSNFLGGTLAVWLQAAANPGGASKSNRMLYCLQESNFQDLTSGRSSRLTCVSTKKLQFNARGFLAESSNEHA